MENASKALIMAGSVLIALMVIAMLVFMFNQLSEARQEIEQADAIEEYSKYAQQFEQYNTTIYGSELLSLANLRDNYNLTQHDVLGYQPIEIKVKTKTERKETVKGKVTPYLNASEHRLDDITKFSRNVENDIKDYEDPEDPENSDYCYENPTEKNKGKQSIKYYSQFTYRQLALLFKKEIMADQTDWDVREQLMEQSSELKELINARDEYIKLKTMYTSFKNTSFKCEKVEYDYNGRLTSMYFVEQDN